MLRGKQAASVRPQIIPLILAAAGSCLLGTAAVVAQQHEPAQDFETCKMIADDRARLYCFKKLLAKAPSEAGEENPSVDHWTHRPNGGPQAVAIMRTADTTQSDPDLAGLVIRCQENPGLELLLALVWPLPPRSRRDVIVTSRTTQSILHAKLSTPGTALALPVDASAFTTGPWRGLKEFGVRINDPEGDIHGVIRLDGIAPAIAKLTASCSSR
jgi:hypothetical protein